MHTAIRPALVLATLGVFGSTDAWMARADAFPTVAYALAAGSTYQEGCFEPCMCPLLQEQAMSGTFDLVFYPFAGPIWTVGVDHVSWKVPTLDKQIEGQGTYRRAGDHHQLTLELQIDGEPPRTFDSGWVPGGDSYPGIDVTLSMNGFFCYDIALHVVAEPVDGPRLEVDRAQLSWTTVPGAATYDVVCGELMALRGSGGDFSSAVDACLADEHPDTVLPYAVPDGAMWFLVRSHGGSYDEGGTQEGSRDEEIAASPAACP